MLPDFPQAEFAAFALILLRVTVLLFLSPIFGSNLVPIQVKAAMSLVFALMLTPVVNIDAPALPDDVLSYIPIIAGEVFVGMAIGLTMRMILEGVQMAGQYIGYQMGMAIVNVIDPQTGSQSSVLSQIAYILALIIFLSVNGHYIVIKALVESFELIPIGRPIISEPVIQEIMKNMAGLFIIAVKIAAPTLAVLFGVKVAMGIVAKAVPQMNVLFVGMPLYIIVGMMVFGFSLSFFVPVFGKELVSLENSVLKLINLM